MEYYSAIERNKIMPFAATWMDLETVIQSEVRERERQISYNIAYMWNLEKWYRCTHLQSRNRVTDVENKLMITKGGKGRGMNWEIGIDIDTLFYIK